jgi:large subunit ribosomal protein L6
MPSGVAIKLSGRVLEVNGPKGSLNCELPGDITVRQDGEQLLVERPNEERQTRAFHGLTRALVANMVVGVTDGYRKQLEIIGVGYRATSKGPNSIELALGYSHPVLMQAPRRRQLRSTGADACRRRRYRQAEGRSGRGQRTQCAATRALQGQGRSIPG